MTERWRKKLGDLDGASPNEDVFARAHEGPQQPDPMVPMPGMGNRVATGIAAFMVFALAISVFAIPALRMNGPAGPGSSQLLPLWPERSLDDLEALQAAADAGDPDAVWVTDPAKVATRFGEQVLGWASVDLVGGGGQWVCDPGPGGECLLIDPPPRANVECSNNAVVASGGETGFACVGTAVAAPGGAYDPDGSANTVPSMEVSSGPTSEVPDPFRIYTLRYDEPCDVCPSPTTVQLYQPLDTGEGEVWAVLEAASQGAELNVATSQALEDGYRIGAALRNQGTTTPTLAYAAGPGSCEAVGFTGSGEMTFDMTDHLSLDLQAGCSADSPGYVWAAQTWKPTIGGGDVLDPLTEGGYGNPAFEFVAFPVTFLANQTIGTFSERPPTTEPTIFSRPTPESGWVAYTSDPEFGWSLDVPTRAEARPVDDGISFQLGDGLVVVVIRISGAPSADDSTFPLDPEQLDPSMNFPVDITFRGDGQAYELFVTSEEGGQLELTDAQRSTIERIVTSIRFGPWQTGETRGEWTAVGEILPNSTAEWVLFDGERYFATHTGDGRALFGPVPPCTDGEGLYEVSEDGTVRMTCPDGSGGGWYLAGEAEPGNSPRFEANLEVVQAVRSSDGMLLASLSEPS